MEGVGDISKNVAPSEEVSDAETKTQPNHLLTDQFQSVEPPPEDNVSAEVITGGNKIVDFNEIDLISKSTSISDVEDGQILESSSDSSDLIEDQQRCSVKRCSSPSFDEKDDVKKSKKRISFSAVTAYYFPRAQGFTCVPSQGGSTLGMSLKHSHVESLSLSEHAVQQRKNHRKLLLQLRKKRKTRSSKEELDCTDGTGSEVTENNDSRETDSDESDEQQISDISDSELDIDNYYFLQPVTTRQRRALLRESGVAKIETSEKEDCRQIRVSRESCGCSCQVYCEPESCSCAQSGIQCQVDRLNFPCGCSRDACANPSGRVEFNPVRVRTHFIHTLMRLELENAEDPSKLLGGGQSQLIHPTDVTGIGDIDGTIGPVATVSDPHYSWENVMQLVPAQQNSSYSLAESNTLTDNSWYSHYSNEPSSYALYSGAPHSAEVFNYTNSTSAYEPIYTDMAENTANSSNTQYTELVDSGQGYVSEYYHDYSQGYNPFENHGFNYNATDNSYSSCTEEAFSYAESGGGSTAFAVNGSSSDGSKVSQAAPKMELSSSSSEEDTVDIGSSLATIVKETMVSV